MSCILKVTDPILKGILGKDQFKTVSELRETFDQLADKSMVIPLYIQPTGKTFNFQKFGKIYKEEGSVKVQIVMPGQEFFNDFQFSGDIPERFRSPNTYGRSDVKTLSFDSIDSFVGFYLANYLYITDTNVSKLISSVTKIVESTNSRIESKPSRHAGAIEDLKFADSLISYLEILYDYAGIPIPSSVTTLYENIKEKWNRFHANMVQEAKVQVKANSNQTFTKSEVSANLFFQAYDFVNGKENTKPLAQARRNLIRGIKDPSKYFVKLVQGNVEQAQQTNDNGEYPSVAQIENGVVGILVDQDFKPVYVTKDGTLSTNPEQGVVIDYEVDGVKRSSNVVTLLFGNSTLKDDFKKSNDKDSFIFKVENTKFQVQQKEFKDFKEAGFDIEDIRINIIKDDPFAGFTYVLKNGSQVIVDSNPLNDVEIEEIVKLLEHTYESSETQSVVDYLNDLISVSADRINNEKTGREVHFINNGNRILVSLHRIKKLNEFVSIIAPPLDINQDKELVVSALQAARVRFRKGQGDSVLSSWVKWEINDGALSSRLIKSSEGKKFYEDHIKAIKVDQKTSSQIATFTERTFHKPTSNVLGSLTIVKDKKYTVGEINQLVMLSVATGTDKDLWDSIYNLPLKKSPRFIFTEYDLPNPAYYDIESGNIYIKLSALNRDKSFVPRAIIEEYLHALTVPRLKQYEDSVEVEQLKQDYEKAKELTQTYKESKDYNKLSDVQKESMDKIVDYYTASFEEFVVGISHPYFRAFLRLGDSRDFIDQVIDKIKKILNRILKDIAPSLYTDVTTDLFKFLVNKPSKIEQVIKQVEQAQESPLEGVKKREKKQVGDSKVVKKFFAPVEGEPDLILIQGIDAEIGNTLFESGAFGDFIQKNVSTNSVWNRMVDNLRSEYNDLLDQDSSPDIEQRLDWIDLFLENENQYKQAWMSHSKLFLFNNDKIFMEEDELESDEDQNFNDQQGKDSGFNKVDSEQQYSRLQLADAYTKMFIKLIPKDRVNGLSQLSDFTSLWNRTQNVIANTLSFDEQVQILSRPETLKILPEAPLILRRLDTISKDINGIIVINNFQNSFSTAKVPVYNTYLTKTDKGYKYSFFESSNLDVQNLEQRINQMFRDFAEPFMTTVNLNGQPIPTYDLNKILNYLSSSKDLVPLYSKIFPIPDVQGFNLESGINNFHAGLVSLIRQRVGKWNNGNSKNTIILNGDFLSFIKGDAVWENFGSLEKSSSIVTLTNKFIGVISKYSPLTVSNMTKNAENQNQSVLLSWSSWLINLKRLNDGESFREQNPMFSYSLTAQLIDIDNQVQPINISGTRVYDEAGWEGTISMDQDFISYSRQEISNMMLNGVCEISRVETKNSSFGYKFRWLNGIHPIPINNFKTSKWQSDLFDIYIGGKGPIKTGYLRGEVERIKKEKDNPFSYYPKYDKIKGDFHLFTYLPSNIKSKLSSLIDIDGLRSNIQSAVLDHVDDMVSQLKKEVFNQTGIPFTLNHPIVNVIELQSLIKDMGFDQFLRAFVVNREIYQIEHFITGHGDIGQHDKPYKRFGSNISTGSPVVINDSTQLVLDNTIDRQFGKRIPTGKSFIISDDNYTYDDPQLKENIKESLRLYYDAFGIQKTENEIEIDAEIKSSPYLKTNVADGQGFMTPDFGRLLMITTGNWSNDREIGFWFLKIQHKLNQGINLTNEELEHYNKTNEEIKDRGIFWMFPPLKMQYRGPFLGSESNVAIEGLDKFSLAWLWPDVVQGTTFEPILNKMYEQGIDYGKFESGTKIGGFKPDDVLDQIRQGNIEIRIDSVHDIDLAYMKEQVKAGEKFKDEMPMSTQARKLVLSNLKFNGKYLNESIEKGSIAWKKSQAKISEKNVKDLMESISTDGVVDVRKLADKVKEELSKRELPQSLTSIFKLYGEPDYQRFEQALSPQLVETLIFSLLKNKVVRPKFPGEHYIQVSSPLFERGGRDLNYYTIKDGKTQPAECKVVLSGEFLKLLEIKEIKDHIEQNKELFDPLSEYEKIEIKRKLLNELILIPEFVNKYRKELTVFSSRIPGQGYNSMDIQIVKEFLPTYLGPIIVPNPLATKKSGTDYDFDKLPTITPVLTKDGTLAKDRVNQMLDGVATLILDPINFHRLVTPNTTDNIDGTIATTLDALGEVVTEPKFDQIFQFSTHLRKWWATKMKDALGIGATNNTFYTLIQDADVKLNDQFLLAENVVVPVIFPFEREDFPMNYPLLQNGIDKLEYVNEFINITVDVAGNDAIGYTGLKRDNSALLLFLLENGVSFEDAFYFINQPIIIRYHQLLNEYQERGYTLGQAKNQAISSLLGIPVEQEGKNIPRNVIYGNIYNMIGDAKFTNLKSSISPKDNLKVNTQTQKKYLAYYLVGLEMANKMKEAQSYNNFDTSPSPNSLYSMARERLNLSIRDAMLFDLEAVNRIHNDSVISHLNVDTQFQEITISAFSIKRNSNFIQESLRLADYIYNSNDKENFFKKFDNDFLLSIVQNFGSISKEKIEQNISGKLANEWRQIKDDPEIKDLTITKYMVENYSTKNSYVSLTLFLGLDGDALTLDQIAKDIRTMTNSSNKTISTFTKDFIETGIYTTGFSQSPTYYLKALPFEVVNGYLKEAYDNYDKLSPASQAEFIKMVSGRFMFQRGMQFGQYWIKEYRDNFGIKNLNVQVKKQLFNQEAWRYTDYKMDVDRLVSLEKQVTSTIQMQPKQLDLFEEEQKDCNLDLPF